MHVLHIKMSIHGTGCEVSIRIMGGPVYVYTGLCSLGISLAHLWKITVSTAEAC